MSLSISLSDFNNGIDDPSSILTLHMLESLNVKTLVSTHPNHWFLQMFAVCLLCAWNTLSPGDVKMKTTYIISVLTGRKAY